jgi:glycosyltransferase involved in cell wall biosynthesis
VLSEYFVPGFRAGGTIRSLDLLTSSPSADTSFYVFTGGHDLGAKTPYPGIRLHSWITEGGRCVCYINTALPWSYARGLWKLRRLRPDVYYLNSLWSPLFSLIPILFLFVGLLPRRPIVLAPRGELAEVMLLVNARRKRAIGWVMKTFILPKLALTWHATSDEEAANIRRWIRTAKVVVVPNLVSRTTGDACDVTSWTNDARPETSLRVLFLSRISPKKNLDGALRALAQVHVETDFRIVGPPEDRRYAALCQRLAKLLPPHVRVDMLGAVEHSGTAEHYRWADVLFLPTKNENFGHVLGEALAHGCPVLASTATPWTPVLAKASVRPLEPSDTEGFAKSLNQLGELSLDDRNLLRQRTREVYKQWLASQIDSEARTLAMLAAAAGPTGKPVERLTDPGTDKQ